MRMIVGRDDQITKGVEELHWIFQMDRSVMNTTILISL